MVLNYTTNLNYENYLNNNLRLFNNIYLRKTKAEYDNSNSNQTGYEGDNGWNLSIWSRKF